MHDPDSDIGIRAFGRAFGARWFVWMSGPLTVPFTFLAIFLDASFSKVLFGLLALICATVCSYLVWRFERQAKNSIQAELNKEKTRNAGAKLTGEISEAIIDEFRPKPSQSTKRPCLILYFYLQVHLQNDGSKPALLRNFKLRVINNEREYLAHPTSFEDLAIQRHEYKAIPDDRGFARTFVEKLNKLETNVVLKPDEVANGWLTFALPEQLSQSVSSITLVVTDGHGTSHPIVREPPFERLTKDLISLSSP